MKFDVRVLGAAAAVAAIALPGVAAAQDSSVTVGTNVRNGVCFIYLPVDPSVEGSPELAISVKASNLNVNVGMSKLTEDEVSSRLDDDAPLTLTLGNGKKISTDHGEFREGFEYRHTGWWTDSADGLPLLSYLNGGTTLTADFGGLHYGPIQIQQSTGIFKNYAYSWLKTCIEQQGGTPDF